MNLSKIKNPKKTLITVWMIYVACTAALAQIPRDIPMDSNPLNIDSPLKIFLYIVLPLMVVLIIYITVRKSKTKNEE